MSQKLTGAGRFIPSSACYWLPKARSHKLLVPSTRFVNVPSDYLAVVGGDEHIRPDTARHWSDAISRIHAAAMTIGGYPVFLRTDLASAKHSGPAAYRIEKRERIDPAMRETLEDNELKWLNPYAFLVRKWLNLEFAFVAFDGHPIAREWRFFATKDRIVCRHFYWPEDSIRFYHGIIEPAGWKAALAHFSSEAPPSELDAVALKFAAVCDRASMWSVDFAKARDGKWWFIDAAVAEDSAHPWDGCELPNNEKHRQHATDVAGTPSEEP